MYRSQAASETFLFVAYISATQVHCGGAGTRVCRDMFMNNNALFTSISVASQSKSGRPNAEWKKKKKNVTHHLRSDFLKSSESYLS